MPASTKRSSDGREFLSLKPDDPSFTTPIFANLFEVADVESDFLIWSRPGGRRAAE